VSLVGGISKIPKEVSNADTLQGTSPYFVVKVNINTGIYLGSIKE